MWGAVVDGSGGTDFTFRVLEHALDACDGKPRGASEMLTNLHLLDIRKGDTLVSDCWKGTIAAVKRYRRAKRLTEHQLRHELVNHAQGEIVNENGYSTNAIEARWSVVKRWVRKRNDGKLPAHSDRARWNLLLNEFRYRKQASQGSTLDYGNTYFVPLKSFLDVLKNAV